MKKLTDSLGFRLTLASYLVVAVFMSVAGVTVYRASKDSIKMGATAMARRMAEELALNPEAPAAALGERLLRLKVQKSGSTWIMDREGNLLYNPDPQFHEEYVAKKKNFGNVQVVLQAASPRASGQGTAKEKLVDIAQKYEEGFGTYKQFGEERILAFRSLPARGLLIAVDEPVSSANSELERVKKYISYTALVSALLIMAFSLLSIRIIIRPYYREMEDLNASLQHSNAQLEEFNVRLVASNRNLTTLYEVGLGLRHSLALQDILALIVNGAHKVLDVDRIAVFLPAPDGKSLELRYWTGGAPPAGPVLVPLAAAGALAHAFQRREQVHAEAGQRLPPSLRLPPAVEGEAFLRSSAFVAVPLVVKDRAVGVIAMDNKLRRSAIGAEQVNLLGIFANQAAVAVDNARLYEQLRQKIAELDARVDQLSILHQIGNSMQRDITRQEALGFILRGILEGIGFSQAAVFLVDRARGALVGELSLGTAGVDVRSLCVPVGEHDNLLTMAFSRRAPVGIAHRGREALLELIGRPLEAGAWSEGVGTPVEGARAACLAVPLIAREEVVGVIAVTRSEPPLIRRHEVELLLLYANTAGLTVERAELYERMHRSLEQLEVTDQVSHLSTHAHGRRQAAEAIARCVAGGKPYAALLVGIDGFSEFNEAAGFECGDRALGEIGEIVRGALGRDAVALRLGGRLLAALLPAAGREQASAIAEGIRAGVERQRFAGRGGGRDQRLSVSVVCGIQGPGGEAPAAGADPFAALLGQLRRAEAAGGNRVLTAGD